MQVSAIIKQIREAKPGFASLLYCSKTDGGISRYTVMLKFSYDTLLIKSLDKLTILAKNLCDIELQAALEIKASLENSIKERAKKSQNERYTKASMYSCVAPGLMLNDKDKSLQLFGLLRRKTVIKEGIKKKVNSSALTLAKNKIRSKLPISKFREFALDDGHLKAMKINGNYLIFE